MKWNNARKTCLNLMSIEKKRTRASSPMIRIHPFEVLPHTEHCRNPRRLLGSLRCTLANSPKRPRREQRLCAMSPRWSRANEATSTELCAKMPMERTRFLNRGETRLVPRAVSKWTRDFAGGGAVSLHECQPLSCSVPRGAVGSDLVDEPACDCLVEKAVPLCARSWSCRRGF